MPKNFSSDNSLSTARAATQRAERERECPFGARFVRSGTGTEDVVGKLSLPGAGVTYDVTTTATTRIELVK